MTQIFASNPSTRDKKLVYIFYTKKLNLKKLVYTGRNSSFQGLYKKNLQGIGITHILQI